MVARFRLTFLHGFLGCGSDWDDVIAALSAQPSLSSSEFSCPDLFLRDSPLPTAPLAAWGEAQASELANLARQDREDDEQKAKTQRILIGYSLGGRLAAHLFLAKPSLWDGVVLVSTHPGIDGTSERVIRRSHDETWARRFESQEWSSLVTDWNQQEVFVGSRLPRFRCEAEFSRQKLAAALRLWSLGNQEPLLPRLRTERTPIMWVFGEKDMRFAGIAARLQEEWPAALVARMAAAGHRIPTDSPQAFARLLCHFCGQLGSTTALC